MKSPLKLTKTKNTLLEFLTSLKIKYGINYIHAEFSGGGDSGEIHEIYGMKDKDGNITDCTKFSPEEQGTVMEVFDKYLEETNYDWYNNDGGSGDITLNIETGAIECNMSINIMSSEDHFLEDEGEFIKKYTL
jgi:hypothetical protein